MTDSPPTEPRAIIPRLWRSRTNSLAYYPCISRPCTNTLLFFWIRPPPRPLLQWRASELALLQRRFYSLRGEGRGRSATSPRSEINQSAGTDMNGSSSYLINTGQGGTGKGQRTTRRATGREGSIGDRHRVLQSARYAGLHRIWVAVSGYRP